MLKQSFQFPVSRLNTICTYQSTESEREQAIKVHHFIEGKTLLVIKYKTSTNTDFTFWKCSEKACIFYFCSDSTADKKEKFVII